MSEFVATQRYSLTGGWVCLICAIWAVFAFGPFGLIIAGPLLLVCWIMAIIGMAKNNTGGGIALLLSSMFLPPIAFVVWFILLAVVGAMSSDAPTHDSGTAIESGVPEEGSGGEAADQ